MPPSRGQARTSAAAEAQAYLDKAQEFLRAAHDSLGLGNNTAAVGNAVHSGIAAADTISAARAGAVWRGEHTQAVKHLESTGGEGKAAARHLRRLLPLKTRAEYEPTPMRQTEAKTAVQAAERIVDQAVAAVASVLPAKKGGGEGPMA